MALTVQRDTMKRLRAYKTKLVLNNAEASYCRGCSGFSRFVYNWGLAEWEHQYESGEKPSAYALKKQFNSIKDEQFPWTREYPYVTEQEAFDHLGRAFANYFRMKKDGTVSQKIAKMKEQGKWQAHVSRCMRRGRTGYKMDPGYPQFKSKHDNNTTFSLRGSIQVENDRAKLPVIGWVRLAEAGYLPTESAKILSANVSKRADDWFISLQVEEDVPEPIAQDGKPLGVDMGIKSLPSALMGQSLTIRNLFQGTKRN